MIVNKNLSTVERNGLVQEGSFSIKASAKAFSILSSGLYSNKILAIVRELSCNAHDSHTAARKQDKQFTIHLPNQVEPYFSVRDFGIGLSHENVMTLYTTYFESTKTESNDFIGALGLGSKSPFSYTDSFTVTSFFAGKKKVYNAFLNEHGVPSIALLFEEDTTEENGLEVKLAIKESDFREFANEAQNVYTYFEPVPKIEGIDPEIVKGIKKPEYILQSKNWGIRKNGRGGTRAIQGQVSYLLPNHYNSAFEKFDIEKDLLKLDIDIYFEIGELEVAASREQLSFDSRTIENIRKKLIEIKDEIGQTAAKDLAKEKTIWQAALVMQTYPNGLNIGNYLPKDHESEIVRHLATFGSSVSVNLETYDKKDEVFIFIFNRKTRYSYVYGNQEGRTKQYSVRPSIQNIVVIDDLKRGLQSRIKHNFQSHKSYIVIKSEKKKLVNKVLKDLGSPPFILASEMETPEPAIRKAKNESYIFDIKQADTEINPKIVDWSKGGIFAYRNGKGIFKKYEAENSNYLGRSSYYEFNDVIEQAQKLKLIGENITIHVISGKFHEKLENKDKWTNIYDLLKSQLKRKITKHEWKDLIRGQQSMAKFDNLAWDTKDAWRHTLININHKDFIKFKETYNSITANKIGDYNSPQATLLREIKKINESLNISFSEAIEDINEDISLELISIIKNIETKYPLIKYCYSNLRYAHKNEEILKEITEYVKMIDKN